MAGNLLALFTGGELSAQVDRADARRQQRLYESGQSVLVAFREVEDALVEEDAQRKRLESLERQMTFAEQTRRRLQLEYLNGVGGFLDVLTAQIAQQQLERDLLDARLAMLENRIALYRALAGGFVAEPAGAQPRVHGHARVDSSRVKVRRQDDHDQRHHDRPPRGRHWRRTRALRRHRPGRRGDHDPVFATEPTAKRAAASKLTPMLVEVVAAERGTFRPEIVAMGTVEPAEDIVLRPRVGGQIVERAPEFTPGGVVTAGQMLVRIDPADFENVLQQRRSDLSQAIADLKLEMGRQSVAQLDYELLGEDLAARNEALVLREPQLQAAQSRVAAAEAAVKQAELDLDRASVTAPFSAQVISREVNVGSQVDVGDPLGRLVGLDAYWIVATVPRDRLRWIEFPDAPGQARRARRDPRSGRLDRRRDPRGAVYSHIAALDDETRLARVLVTVPDPLGRRPGAPDEPPLVIGAYVEARIGAREVADVVRLELDLVRQGDTVWVMEGDSLRIPDVEIVLRDARYAYVSAGLEAGDRIVTTDLATVAEGAPLRLVAPPGDTP